MTKLERLKALRDHWDANAEYVHEWATGRYDAAAMKRAPCLIFKAVDLGGGSLEISKALALDGDFLNIMRTAKGRARVRRAFDAANRERRRPSERSPR